MKLYEILVPTMYGDTIKPIRTKHHKNWDAKVQKLTGGLTIFTPGKGVWEHEGETFLERVIPVRIMCADDIMAQIVQITIDHYRQKAVMYYVLSDECHIVYADGATKPTKLVCECDHLTRNWRWEDRAALCGHVVDCPQSGEL